MITSDQILCMTEAERILNRMRAETQKRPKRK